MGLTVLPHPNPTYTQTQHPGTASWNSLAATEILISNVILVYVTEAQKVHTPRSRPLDRQACVWHSFCAQHCAKFPYPSLTLIITHREVL